MNDNNNHLLDVLTREGVLINVSVRYWRATKKLNAEDLGLDPESVETRLISLGHKNLIPREALQTFALIEGRAHALVEGNTFPFLNGLGHFLPNARLQETTDKLAQLEREFMAEKDNFLGQYAETRDKALAEWREAAARLVNNPAKLVETIEIPGHPWFLACQFHPEFTSTPRGGHPLFTGFIGAAREHAGQRQVSA